MLQALLTLREKAFIAAEVVANNQVSSRVTESAIYYYHSQVDQISSKLQLKIYLDSYGIISQRRKCEHHHIHEMNFTHLYLSGVPTSFSF